jgi:hypothetical protein
LNMVIMNISICADAAGDALSVIVRVTCPCHTKTGG